ncbi:uncharacterized protein LOC132714877 [Ruditapes philippinarum]|uniref:uncharacterized protein LOC132714877 n=1 Tax=Ruditapes philippinarum TaxID=129788 RepID=UPI00295BB4E0|nr:uncharacterized protein LOC132714877 [Ruditapes philippinarum]
MASFGNDSQPDKNQLGCYQIIKVGKFWLLKVNERSMRIKFLDHAKDVFIEETFLIADDEIFEIKDNESGELSIKKVEEFLHNPIECDLSTDQNENLFEVGNAEIDKAIEIENENLDKDVNKHNTNSIQVMLLVIDEQSSL